MNVTNIFTSFIASDMLNLDNDKLIKQCSSVSTDHYHLSKEETTDELKRLHDQVAIKFNEVAHGILGISKKYNVEITDTWVNKGAHEYITEAHLHPKSLLSAVYYVKSDLNQSSVKFFSPVQAIISEKLPQSDCDNIVQYFTPYNSSAWMIPSLEGMLLVFPSWLLHQVLSKDNSRISIAFNTNLCHE